MKLPKIIAVGDKKYTVINTTTKEIGRAHV